MTVGCQSTSFSRRQSPGESLWRSKKKKKLLREPSTFRQGCRKRSSHNQLPRNSKEGGRQTERVSAWQLRGERESQEQGEAQDGQRWQGVKLGKRWKAYTELSNREFDGVLSPATAVGCRGPSGCRRRWRHEANRQLLQTFGGESRESKRLLARLG